MNTIGDVLKAIRDVLLLQSQMEQLNEQIGAQESRLSSLSDRVNDIDKRLYAMERIMEFGARQAQQKRIEE